MKASTANIDHSPGRIAHGMRRRAAHEAKTKQHEDGQQGRHCNAISGGQGQQALLAARWAIVTDSPSTRSSPRPCPQAPKPPPK
jgi:hypothetical protein